MANDARAVSDKSDASPPTPALVGATLTSEELRAFKQTLWRERLYSLWAPITSFGALLALYIVLIGFHTASYLWAQPVMKGIGLIALLSFVGLLIARNLIRPFGKLRQARHFVYEVRGELEAALGNKAISKEKRVVGEQSYAALTRLYSHGSVEELLKHGEDVSKYVEKDLGRKKFGTDFVFGFVKAFAVAMIIRTVIIEPFKIPSGSMIPTLEIGDQIFVNKFIYGVRIPWMNKVLFQIVRAPARGDVIVFNNPVDTDKDFVKRIVGLAGDRISIEGDVISLNGTPQARTLVAPDYVFMEQNAATNWLGTHALLYSENLAGHEHPTLQASTGRGVYLPNGQTDPEFTVPEGHVFVMGDNRDNSSDGRFGMGLQGVGNQLVFVPLGNIKGKAMVVWLALGHGGIGQSIFGGTGFRTDRLFKPVR